MKKIAVTDEMYDFLIGLSEELNTQSHRATRMPYFFQIQTMKQVAAADGNGTMAWFYDGAMIETDEEIKEAVLEYKGWEKDELFNSLADFQIEEILEDIGWSKVYYEMKEKLENSFFTEKACKLHIKMNGYHYNNPVDYLSYASRNPEMEMEMIMKFLCELTGGKLHT